MNCPSDNEQLQKVLFHDVEVDYCPRCLGIWFDEDELRLAKDDEDKQLNWIDVDLWRDKSKFTVLRADKYCPACRVGLQEVRYDTSKVRVDFCKLCKGVWLDRGEFRRIINYLKNKSDYEILHHYTKNFALELWEVFSGPEKFRSELADFFTVLRLLNYKFVTQHPFLNSLIENSQK